MSGTALVTGASSGIGLELARLLARDGYRLVLVARREDKLRELAEQFKQAHGVDSIVLPFDLAEASSPRQIFERLRDVEVDILVNNAGYTVYGEFVDTPPRAEMDMLQVNVMALTELTKLFVPLMKQRGRGRVLNVASTAAFVPGPLMACYYASKAYVLSFSEALGQELEGSGVTVTVLCPGSTETGFGARGGVQDVPLFSGPHLMSPVRVARVGYRSMMRGRRVAVVGLKNQAMVFGMRFAPRTLLVEAVRKLQATRRK